MALLFMDSFDAYVTADITEKWTAAAPGSIQAGAGRRGSSAYRGTTNTHHFSKGLNTTSSTIILGAALKPGTLDQPCFNVGESATTHLLVWVAADGAIQVYRTGGGAGWTAIKAFGPLLATSAAGLLSVGVYVHVETKVVIHASTGTVEVRLNGATVLSATGLNTSTGGSGIGNLVYIGGPHDIDDLSVCDGTGAAPWNDFLGDCRVDALYPTGAGATTGWTPSAGANWQCVDDTVPNDDTDYTSAAAAGVTDTFVVPDAPVVGAAIYGVQHCVSAKKSDAGAAAIAAVVRHSGVDYVGADLNPGTAYAVLQQIHATNPGTAAAWTEAGFNAAEFGYKRTA